MYVRLPLNARRIAAGVVGFLLAGLISTSHAEVESGSKTIDNFSGGQTAARGAWRPMTGSPEVSVARIDGKQALRMVCKFRDTHIERASWDRKIALDLTGRKGVQFMFRGAGVESVGYFSIYFRSGRGWYAAGFEAPGGQGWGLVKVLKKDVRVEGSPSGWGKIDTIRISAWRGGNTDGEFQIAELATFGSGGRIAVIRCDSAAASSEAKSIERYANVVANLLDMSGLDHTILSDADVSEARLERMQLAILPYNPVIPDKTAKVLSAYIGRGGKLIACYSLGRSLAEQAGIRMGGHTREKHKGYFASIRPAASGERIEGMPEVVRQASWNICSAEAVKGKSHIAAWWHTSGGESTGLPAVVLSDSCAFVTHVLLSDDMASKQSLLLSLAGRLAPEIWRDAAAGALKRTGQFEPYGNYQAALKGIATLAGEGGRAVVALKRAEVLYNKASRSLVARKYAKTVSTAADVRRTLIDAHCLAQESLAGEPRAFWCHNALGVNGMTWDQAIEKLADNGFNAILPNMLWGGAAYYKSDVLPVSSQVKDKGDQIALCLAACRKYGVACHVWKVNYYMGRATPRSFSDKVKSAGRTQVHFDGSPIADWLCPSHPANQKLEIDSMLEVARKYAVDGLHFDYIRYPGAQGCFCVGCRKRFEKQAGARVARWPADVRNDNDLRAKWLDFRRQQITTVVSAVSARARKIRPKIKISAAVFSNLPADRDRIGQDWGLWCKRGYLDFVCPMDYTPKTASFAQAVARQVKWAGPADCRPGIGASVWTPRADPCKVIAQIRAARQAGAKGFTIFNYAQTEAMELLPMLSKGITRKSGAR
ncbi:MAG: family 10 glycosylhydrolase [Phycisphaerae bacterium]|jgi:uncharacterized lipoprotein YddW (UPF0748 family)|nr:family 10 glycosylhydrolase [Phycisphaerae bacterium]